MTLGVLPAPEHVAAVGAPRFWQQQRLAAGLDVFRGARALRAAAIIRCSSATGGGIPALQPRPVPSPQQSSADSQERSEQLRGASPAVEQQNGRHPDGSPQLPRRRADNGGRPEPMQQRQHRGGGAARLAELPAGNAEQDPDRGPAKRSLDVGSPRRREATLARALLRLPATETNYGAVLGGEQLSGPEITRCAAQLPITAMRTALHCCGATPA